MQCARENEVRLIVASFVIILQELTQPLTSDQVDHNYQVIAFWTESATSHTSPLSQIIVCLSVSNDVGHPCLHTKFAHTFG